MGVRSMILIACFAVLLLLNGVAAENLEGLHYEEHQPVAVLGNRVGPYDNSHEIYRYDFLPFCSGDDEVAVKHAGKEIGLGLGQVFAGDRRIHTPYKITFGDNVDWASLCTKTISASEVDLFRRSVEEDFFFELIIDGLPIWGYVGDFHDDFLIHREAFSEHFIYTHIHFDITYNDDRIIGVNVTTPPEYQASLPYHDNVKVDFTYSVRWKPSTIKFEDRMKIYHEFHFLPEHIEIHWLSIINSAVLVLLLLAFLGVILVRFMNNDFARYMGLEEDEELGPSDETGWKLIHGDVFRSPAMTWAFCPMVGTGCQMLVVIFGLLVLALMGVFPPTRRGAVTSACVILYCSTTWIAGSMSSRLHRQLQGASTGWISNALFTALVIPVPLAILFFILNSIAWANNTTSALPFGTIVLVTALYGCVALPLSIVGSIAGRNTATDFEAPCRVNRVPRQIPDTGFQGSLVLQIFVSGFLPFSAIYIELHYIFAAMWGHKIYTLFGILFLAFCLLVLVTAFITVTMTYMRLTAEDHRWWWRSLVSGGAVGIFAYIYCFFFYFHRSNMSGVVQTSFFFGYMGIICYAFFLALISWL